MSTPAQGYENTLSKDWLKKASNGFQPTVIDTIKSNIKKALGVFDFIGDIQKPVFDNEGNFSTPSEQTTKDNKPALALGLAVGVFILYKAID